MGQPDRVITPDLYDDRDYEEFAIVIRKFKDGSTVVFSTKNTNENLTKFRGEWKITDIPTALTKLLEFE